MHENQSQTESLLDIVRSIRQETLLLPEFQRDSRRSPTSRSRVARSHSRWS